jgi:hypothetical protein
MADVQSFEVDSNLLQSPWDHKVSGVDRSSKPKQRLAISFWFKTKNTNFCLKLKI